MVVLGSRTWAAVTWCDSGSSWCVRSSESAAWNSKRARNTLEDWGDPSVWLVSCFSNGHRSICHRSQHNKMNAAPCWLYELHECICGGVNMKDPCAEWNGHTCFPELENDSSLPWQRSRGGNWFSSRSFCFWPDRYWIWWGMVSCGVAANGLKPEWEGTLSLRGCIFLSQKKKIPFVEELSGINNSEIKNPQSVLPGWLLCQATGERDPTCCSSWFYVPVLLLLWK